MRTFLRALEIENVSEDQKLQITLALREGGCGIRSHDLKELQRLYVSSALLVAPVVFAATGESIGSAAPDADEGGTLDSQLSSSIRDLVAYGCSHPDFNDGGPLSAKVWADSVSLKFNKILSARIEHLHQMLAPEDCKRARTPENLPEHASNHVAVSARNGLQQFQLDLKQCLMMKLFAYACVLDSDLKPMR